MKKISLVFLVLLTLLFSLNVYAAPFNFVFDDSDTGSIDTALIGAGTFDFSTNVSDGHHELTDLGTYSFSFFFNLGGTDYIFDSTEMLTPAMDVKVIISNSGQQVSFATDVAGPPNYFGGSLEFQDTDTNYVLSFMFAHENSLPTYYNTYSIGLGTTSYPWVMDTNSSIKGDYDTSAVPVPAALWLFGSGVAGLALLRRKRS